MVIMKPSIYLPFPKVNFKMNAQRTFPLCVNEINVVRVSIVAALRRNLKALFLHFRNV